MKEVFPINLHPTKTFPSLRQLHKTPSSTQILAQNVGSDTQNKLLTLWELMLRLKKGGLSTQLWII